VVRSDIRKIELLGLDNAAKEEEQKGYSEIHQAKVKNTITCVQNMSVPFAQPEEFKNARRKRVRSF
jgi:hypothetical protein